MHAADHGHHLRSADVLHIQLCCDESAVVTLSAVGALRDGPRSHPGPCTPVAVRLPPAAGIPAACSSTALAEPPRLPCRPSPRPYPLRTTTGRPCGAQPSLVVHNPQRRSDRARPRHGVRRLRGSAQGSQYSRTRRARTAVGVAAEHHHCGAWPTTGRCGCGSQPGGPDGDGGLRPASHLPCRGAALDRGMRLPLCGAVRPGSCLRPDGRTGSAHDGTGPRQTPRSRWYQCVSRGRATFRP